MKKTFLHMALLLTMAMIVPLSASAYDFVVNNIYYNITGDNTVSVTYKDSSFDHYSGTVTVPTTVTNGGVTYRVTGIGDHAFRSCPNLVAVNLPNSVIGIGYASFYKCLALSRVNIPNSVTYIDSFAFRECTSLTEITIPGSIPYMGGQVFQGCTALRQVTLNEGLEALSAGTFYQCSALESIVIPSTTTAIYTYCFADCTSLTDITIPSATITIDSEAFINTPWLVNQPDGLIYAGKVAYKYKGTVPVGSTITLRSGTVAISNRLFVDQDGLVGILIPSSVFHVEAPCVVNCQNLATIKVATTNPTLDSRNNCNAIIETATNKVIAGCNNTKIPSSVTAIGTFAFAYCYGLANAQLHEGIKTIEEYAYGYCSALTSIDIPASVTSIENYAFTGCDHATSMTVASGNTTYDSREGCNAIIETATNTLIAGCTKTVIPNSITTIGDGAFHWQVGMSTISIPASVTSIGSYAFYNMYNLETIVCEATTPPSILGTAFDSYARNYAILYVPRASIEAYRNTEVWNWFPRIRAIENMVNGDVDGDGTVGISDVTALIDYILTNNSTSLNLYNADCDKDRNVTIADVTLLIDTLLNN